jgi:outer membrane protein OmpA-like peptidoglycan-associated protein
MKLIGSLAVVFVSASGCAATLPPQDLLTARADYKTASHGPAATFDPADLHEADVSLAAAEHAFQEEGDTQKTRDLAYIADRRAQIADTKGITLRTDKEQQQTVGKMHDAQTAQLARTTGQLGQANTQLKLQGQALQNQSQALDVEKQRRDEAEKRAAKAAADLAAFASVKQETRGMVITLSGAVLFISGKAELMASAMQKLNNVAEALTKQDTESKIVVEGHTDSQGGAAYNQDLSERRAQAVRDYLVTRGIAADRITAQGFGLTRPIADNNTPEGRANNRRVEIVVQPALVKVSSTQ